MKFSFPHANFTSPVARPPGALCSAKFTLVTNVSSVYVMPKGLSNITVMFFSLRELLLTPFHKHLHDQDNIPLPRVRNTGPPAGTAAAPRTVPVVPAAKSGSGEICRFYPNCSRGGACFYYHPPPVRSKPPPQPAHSRPMVKGQRPMPGSYKWTSAATRP